MGQEQIIVRLNPDVPPTGSDLACVNSARRSFNKRSTWDLKVGDKGPYSRERVLKDSDKRLIEFLARGMTADDFEQFQFDLLECAWDIDHNVDYKELGYKSQSAAEEGFKKELKEMLWQWRNTPTHDTPFNHSFISFDAKIPMFTARQLVKTEYTILSEISRRYITTDLEFYEPTYRNQSKDKKQGSVGIHPNTDKWEALSRENAIRCVELYNKMVYDGVAIEQARGELPSNLMVEWTWSGTMGAMAKMCRERLGQDAQEEARFVAEQVYGYLKEYWPVSAKALVEGVDV